MKQSQRDIWIEVKKIVVYFLVIALLSYVESVFQLFTFLFFSDSSITSIIINSFLLLSAYYILIEIKVRRSMILGFPVVFIFLNVLFKCLFSVTMSSCIYGSLSNINYYFSYIPSLFLVYFLDFLFKPKVAKRPVSNKARVDGSGTGDT